AGLLGRAAQRGDLEHRRRLRGRSGRGGGSRGGLCGGSLGGRFEDVLLADTTADARARERRDVDTLLGRELADERGEVARCLLGGCRRRRCGRRGCGRGRGRRGGGGGGRGGGGRGGGG